MIVEVRISLAESLTRTIARTGDGITQACNLLQGLDRTQIRVHGHLPRREGKRLLLVYRLAPDTASGNVLSRTPDRVLIVK